MRGVGRAVGIVGLCVVEAGGGIVVDDGRHPGQGTDTGLSGLGKGSCISGIYRVDEMYVRGSIGRKGGGLTSGCDVAIGGFIYISIWYGSTVTGNIGQDSRRVGEQTRGVPGIGSRRPRPRPPR